MKKKLIFILPVLILAGIVLSVFYAKSSLAQSEGVCFLPGTLIKTPSGFKTIESLEPGEEVLNGSGQTSLVGFLMKRIAPGYYYINNGLLEVTGTHPIYVKKPDGRIGWGSVEPVSDEQWTAIGENLLLERGDSVLGLKVGWIPVYSIKFISGEVEVFNLKNVEPDSTFYANGVLVHNKNSGNEGSGGVASDSNDPGACGNGDGSIYLPPSQNGSLDWSNPSPTGPITIDTFVPVPCSGAGCSPVTPTPPGFTPTGGGGGGGGYGCVAYAGQICQSLQNSCGLVSSGRLSCNGVCVAIPPPDSQCPLPGAAFGQSGGASGDTLIINRGQPCTIEWTATNATSCTLTGPGVSASGITGRIQTPPLTTTTVYVLSCRNGSQSVSRNFTCRINPNFNEF